MRRPARLERAGALTPRDRIWAAIRRFGVGAPFSVAEIMLLSGERADAPLDFANGQRADTTLEYLRGLSRAGVLADGGARLVNRPVRELQWFRLVKDIGVDAPRVDRNGKPVTQGAGRDQMWRSARVLKEFDYRDLAAAASTEAHPVSIEEAQTYIRFLKLGGYVRVARAATYGHHGAAERLHFIKARDTGPRAPIVTRDKSVMDGNTGEIVFKGAANDQ